MKKINLKIKGLPILLISLYSILSTQYSFAQAPQGINYQGVARDAAGNALSKQNIAVEFKIWVGNPGGGGSINYVETYSSVLTDTFGLYSLVIGSGSATTGTFSVIPWSGGNIWVQVYIDPTGGTSYSLIASQQLMSVPYALYAETSGSGGGTISGTVDNVPKINATGNGLTSSILFENSGSLGVNTSTITPDALVDMASTSKGLLIPRMTDVQRTSIASPTHGLMVFQTNNASISSPEGFWYYDATLGVWMFLPPALAVWTIGGNVFTNPGTNFIGTLDAKDLVFKTGNIENMRILNSTGQIQFGTTGNGEYAFPDTAGNAGDILQLDPSGSHNLFWKNPSGGGSGPWKALGGAIFQTNMASDSVVGIGTNSPASSLDIQSSNSIGALNVLYNGFSSSPAITFQTQNSSNGSTVLDVITTGSGEAIRATSVGGAALSGLSSGGGQGLFVQNNASGAATIDAENFDSHSVGYFHNNFPGGASNPTLVSVNNGTGNAGLFSNSNATNDSAALIGYTVGKGFAIFGYSQGTGDAGFFAVNNPASKGNGLIGATNGIGKAVFGINTGLGYGGVFIITNATNDSAAIAGVTNGKGNAGIFQITNSSSTAAGVKISTNGSGVGIDVISTTGAAISASATSASALNTSNSGGGNTINAMNTGTIGGAGNFQINNNSNNSPAIIANTNGTGPGIQTDKIRITQTGPQTGFVLSASNASGDAVWSPVAGATNFGVNVSSVAQTFTLNSNNVTINLAPPTYVNGGASFSGNKFTAPTNGLYHFDVQITVVNQNFMAGGNVTLALVDPTPNTPYKQNQYVVPSSGGAGTFSQPFMISVDINLTAGQQVVLALSNNSTGTNYTVNTNPLLSWFNGHKVF